MTLIETLERHRDRLLLETPQTFDGKLALETSIAELEFYIAQTKAEALTALDAEIIDAFRDPGLEVKQ